ncbi:MAG: LLM class flavin-dependent oxidoreductase [Actinomycetota bacterium]
MLRQRSDRPRVALEIWGGDPRALITVARHAEAVGLDGVYVGESPTALNAETWTTLGLLAATTERIRIGPVIANLLPAYRSTVLLGRQAANLAIATGGRLDFRTGVGAARPAAASWWEPAGITYPSYDARWATTDRELETLRRMWADDTTQPVEPVVAASTPVPPIPVTVAATSERGIELARRHADVWETSWCTVDEWRDRDTVAGLPPSIGRSLEIDGFVGLDAAGVERTWARVGSDRAGEDLDLLRAKSLHGTPETVADQIATLGSAGVEQLVVALHDPNDLDAISALGRALAD